jgi:hypothetical protein
MCSLAPRRGTVSSFALMVTTARRPLGPPSAFPFGVAEPMPLRGKFKSLLSLVINYLAEREGFEPSIPF